LLVAFRILRDVVVYRIRNHEMANVASSLSIMVAMRLEWRDAAVRFVFSMALNAAVYLINDIFDAAADRVSENKDACKTAYLQEHKREAWQAVGIPVAIMVALGLVWNHELLVVLAVTSVAFVAYSAKLKRVAFLDLPTIFVCAVTGSMMAFPLNKPMGWCLVGLLGCFAMCFQTVQMVRDHDEDAAFGTRTTAVALGTRYTMWLHRGLLAVAALYTSLWVHRWVGAAMLLVVLLPFDAKRATVHWSRLRLALGIAWLAVVAWVLWKGSLHGVLLDLPGVVSME